MRRGSRQVLLALTLVASIPSAGVAQVAIGITGGVNTATLTGDDVDNADISAKTGGSGGGYANIYLGSRFSAEGQLLFTAQGFNADSISFSQGYISVPMLLKVYFGKVNLFLGPAINWQVSCSADVDTADAQCDTAANTLWSGIAGAGLQFGKLGVEVHYETGFSDTFEDVDASYGVWYLMGRLALLGSR